MYDEDEMFAMECCWYFSSGAYVEGTLANLAGWHTGLSDEVWHIHTISRVAIWAAAWAEVVPRYVLYLH